MNYELKTIFEKVKGDVICKLNSKTEKFSSIKEFENSNFEKNCKVRSIRLGDGAIELELEKVSSAAELNAKFIKDNLERYGVEPNLFDGV
jgi:hypothetical protein